LCGVACELTDVKTVQGAGFANHFYKGADFSVEGFDPAGIADPVFWLDPATNAYERLTPQRHADIVEGRVKL
jgi:hypothetical protein